MDRHAPTLKQLFRFRPAAKMLRAGSLRASSIVCLSLLLFSSAALADEPTTSTAATHAKQEYAQADNFGQACALFFQSCYYCCLGCGDLGFNFAAVKPLVETPLKLPQATSTAKNGAMNQRQAQAY